MTTALIVTGLLAGLPVTIGPLLAVICHNSGTGEPEHQGADEAYAAELHDMAAPGCYRCQMGDPCSGHHQTAAEVYGLGYGAAVDAAAPGPRRLAADWPQQLDVPTVPELPVPVLVRPYVYGRHHEDTVEIVPADYRLPTGYRRPLSTDTQQMTAVQGW